MNQIRVALIDGNEQVRAGRAMVISSQPDLKLVFEESNPNNALSRAADYLVDVIAVAQKQSGFPGFDFIRRLNFELAKSGSNAAVLVVSNYSNSNLRFQAIQNGASDLIGLEEGAERFLKLIRSVSKRDYISEPNFLAEQIRSGNFPSGSADLITSLELLTPEQNDLLKLFILGLADSNIAKRADVAMLRVRKLLDSLMMAGSFTTRNQLLIALLKERQ